MVNYKNCLMAAAVTAVAMATLVMAGVDLWLCVALRATVPGTLKHFAVMKLLR